MKRIKGSIGLAVVGALVAVVPVLAVVYSTPYTITETNSNAYTMLGVSVLVGNQWLADNGFMEADALDTRIETLGGLEKPHMVVEDRTLAAVAVSANSQTNLYFTTGDTDQNMIIIPGYGGYLTVPDAAGLELGNNFEIEIDGYIDTTTGSNKNLVYKEEAFRVYINGTGEIVTYIAYGVAESVTPNGTGFDSAWLVNTGSKVDAVLTNDGDTTYIYHVTSSFANQGFTFGDLAANVISIQSVRLYAVAKTTANVTPQSLYVGVRINSTSYANGTNASLTSDTYVELSPSQWEYTISPATSVAWTVDEFNGAEFYVRTVRGAGATSGDNRVTQFWVVVEYTAPLVATATGVSSGEHIVKVTADTTDLKIFIDTVEEDTIALTGASVLDNANDWIINQNNVMPYIDYYKHTVAGVLHALYQPNAIVDTTGEAGTADAGATTTLDDAILTQANDYWNGARLIIVTTTDGNAPQGEDAVITDFDAASDRLTFAALTAAVDAGDTYTVDFGTLIDRSSYALDFDSAIPSYIEIPADQTQLDFTSGDFSFILRFKVDDLSSLSWLLARGNYNADGYEFYLNTNGSISFRTYQSGDLQTSSSSAADFVTDTWYTIGFSRTGTSIRILKNGIDVTATVGAHTNPAPSSRSVKIGIADDKTAYPFDGKIEFLMVYDRALSEAEHLYISNNGWPQSESGLVLWLKMEDGSGATSSDSSAYNSDGTITGASWATGESERPAGNSGTNDSRITWGVNPAGVTVAIGGMISESQPAIGISPADDTIDILPAAAVSDWFVEPDVSGTLLDNPFRPFVVMMSKTTTINELQAWRLLALAGILFVTMTAIVSVRGHLLIAGTVACASIGIAVAWTIFPMWALVFAIMAVVGGLISERSPSL